MKVVDATKQRIHRIKNPIPIDQLEIERCKNCEHEFQGRFCPNCGQEVAEFNRPFGFLLYDIFGNFFAFDTRLIKTGRDLLLKPGFITAEFFAGRRMRYAPPVRILVFLSFVLFLLLQTLSNRSLQQSLDSTANPSIKQSDTVSLDVNNLTISAINTNDEALDSNRIKKNIPFTFNAEESMRENIQELANDFDDEILQAETPEDRRQMETYSNLLKMPEVLISKVLDLLSWMFFALVPIFALILELFFWPPKNRYIKHLIFSTHFHSFQFFIFIVVAALVLIFPTTPLWLMGIIILSIPVYLFVAIRKFYQQGIGKSLRKFVAISLLYHMVLISALILVIIKTFDV